MKKVIKFIKEDVKSDIKALKEIGEVTSGQKELPQHQKDKFRKVFLEGWGDWFVNFVKKGWIGFLILILSFLVGWHFSAIHYQNECNVYIYDTYIEPQTGQFGIHKQMYGSSLEEGINWSEHTPTTLIFGINVS